MHKVIKNFIDLETNKKYLKDDEYSPSSQKRGKELVKKGFILEVEKPKKEKKSDKS